jgi:uncharacterized repeat protein (TIGR02543 family)
LKLRSPLSVRYVAIALITVLVVLSFLSVQPVESISTNLYPSADSWVEYNYPNNNHGTESTLHVQTLCGAKRAYLKFDLSSIPAGQAISSAILRLYCSYAFYSSIVEVDAHATGDSWSEGTITWNNAPSVGALIAANPAVGVAGYYYSWDITSYIAAEYAGDKIASVVLKFPQESTGDARHRDFYSKEKYGTSYDPYLQIVYTQPIQQYYLTVSSPYDSPTPTSGWFNTGTLITASVTSPVAGPSSIRYVCTGWTGTGNVPASGSGTSVSFTISQNSSITWNWKTQYLLTVLTSPGGLNPPPTRNPTGEAGPTNGWWYDTSVSVTLTAQSVTGYTFDYWDVDGSSKGAGVNPISVTMSASHTARVHYTVETPQYYLTVSSAYGSPSPTSGWFASGTYITASVTSPVAGPSGTQYVCTGWTGTGSVPSSGTGTSVSFTITQLSSITWNWKTQYYLTVSSPYGTSGGEGWYDSGATAYATVTPLIVSGSAGTRYVFTSWSGDASGTTSPSDPIIMDGPKTAIANWKTQYYLTVSSPYGTPGGEGWYDSGSTAYATLDTSTVNHGNGTRRVFTNWGGGASGTNYVQSDPMTMDGPKTATGNWKTQYYLTVTSLHGTLGGEGWYDSGATAYATVSPLIVPGSSGMQYVFTSWSGDASGTTSPSDPIIMDGPKTAIANWKTQYYLTISSAHGTPGGEGWYNSGDTAYATVTPLIVSGPSGTQYVFTHWSGDASGTTSPSDPIIMDGPKTATGNWKTQYYLTVSTPSNSPPYGSPTPTSGWFDAGTPITASVTSPWPGPSGTQYVCTGWTGTGSVPPSGTETSVTFTLNEPSSITWNWKTQYLLTVRTSPPGLSPQPSRNPLGEAGPPDGWWYDTPVNVQLTAQSVTGHTFDHWEVDGSSQGSGFNPISVSMNAPHTAIAYYSVPPQKYYLTLVTNPYGSAPLVGEGLYDADTYASISAPEFVDIVSGASRYKFNGWTTADMAEITNPSALSTTVLMDKSKTVTANYIVQYYLTVTSAHGTSGGEGWYGSGATAYATVTPLTVSGSAGTRYVFTSWSGDASGATSPSNPILMNGPKIAIANWKTEYYSTVKTDPLGVVSIPGEGWYDTSYSVSLTAPSVSGYDFLNWDVDGSPRVGNPISVVMDGSHTATAHYQWRQGPVGGYSVSLDQPLETAPLVGYTMILAMFGVAVSLIKRKRK